jgi:hypothetical protein
MTKKKDPVPATAVAPDREMEPLNGGGGTFHSWAAAAVGDVLEGTFGGMEPGKFGNNYVLVVDGQPVKFAATAGLADLARVKVGAYVRILHEGLQTGKNGREYRAFHIDVEKGGKLELQASV